MVSDLQSQGGQDRIWSSTKQQSMSTAAGRSCSQELVLSEPGRLSQACEVVKLILQPGPRAVEQYSCEALSSPDNIYGLLFSRDSGSPRCAITRNGVRNFLNEMASIEHNRLQQQERLDGSSNQSEEDRVELLEQNVFTNLLAGDAQFQLRGVARSCRYTAEQRLLASLLSEVLFGDVLQVNRCVQWYQQWWVWTLIVLGALFLILCIVLGVLNGKIKSSEASTDRLSHKAAQ